MKNIEDINKESVNKILASKKYPQFFPGDIVKIGIRITESKRERIQYFEGVCIAKKKFVRIETTVVIIANVKTVVILLRASVRTVAVINLQFNFKLSNKLNDKTIFRFNN